MQAGSQPFASLRRPFAVRAKGLTPVSDRLRSQMGTNKCASQAGMTAYGTRRHLYDPKTQTDKPYDQTTISLQMGTNKGASQVCPPFFDSTPLRNLPKNIRSRDGNS